MNLRESYRIPTRPNTAKNQKESATKANYCKGTFQDKEFMKSHFKNLPKGAKYRVADDFTKEAL